MREHCRALFHFLSTKRALNAQKTGDAPSTKSLKNEHYLHRPSVCRARSVVSGSTLRTGSRHFSQSVFLHVKWPARNLSNDPATISSFDGPIGSCRTSACMDRSPVASRKRRLPEHDAIKTAPGRSVAGHGRISVGTHAESLAPKAHCARSFFSPKNALPTPWRPCRWRPMSPTCVSTCQVPFVHDDLSQMTDCIS